MLPDDVVLIPPQGLCTYSPLLQGRPFLMASPPQEPKPALLQENKERKRKVSLQNCPRDSQPPNSGDVSRFYDKEDNLRVD